jgi:hypothetical protein
MAETSSIFPFGNLLLTLMGSRRAFSSSSAILIELEFTRPELTTSISGAAPMANCNALALTILALSYEVNLSLQPATNVGVNGLITEPACSDLIVVDTI